MCEGSYTNFIFLVFIPWLKNDLKFGFGRTFFVFGCKHLNSIPKCSSYDITLYLYLF